MFEIVISGVVILIVTVVLVWMAGVSLANYTDIKDNKGYLKIEGFMAITNDIISSQPKHNCQKCTYQQMNQQLWRHQRNLCLRPVGRKKVNK